MSGSARPLLLTADTELLDDLLGTAAAVGVAVDVAVEPTTCRPQWTKAPLVLVGADLAPAVNAARLSGLTEVVLVTRGDAGDDLRRLAVELDAAEVVSLPAGEPTLLDRLADVVEPTVRARVLGVVPGRGGAGASVLAAGLALTAAGDGPAWLIDLDPLGGGADAGVGAELSTGARWSDLGVATGRLSPGPLRQAVPEVLGVAVVATDPRCTGDPAPEAVRSVLSAARRGGGTVVVDLPRHGSAARDEVTGTADDLIVVVPAEIRAVLAARQVVTGLGRSRPRMIVRPVPNGLPAEEVARAVELPCAGVLPDEPAVRAALSTGDARGLVENTKLAALCGRLLGQATALRSAA